MGDAKSLAGLPLFDRVPVQDLRQLCALAPPTAFPAGSTLIEAGTEADVALLLVAGKLEALVGEGSKARSLGEILPGEVAGERGIFGAPGTRNATVRAVEPSQCLVLTRDVVQRARDNRALVALERHLLEVLAQRIRSTNAVVQGAWRDARQANARPGPSIRDRLRSLWGRR